MQSLSTKYTEEYDKFQVKPSKAHATRLRLILLEINKLTTQLRKELLDMSKALPTKQRTKKLVPIEQVKEETQVVEPIIKQIESPVETPIEPVTEIKFTDIVHSSVIKKSGSRIKKGANKIPSLEPKHT